MASATALYTPQMLALATGLASFPMHDDLPLRGQARSPTCGSSLELGLALDGDGRISAVGMRTHACAIGQAAAAIFAGAAPGRSAAQIAVSLAEIESWLDGQGQLPDWPGLSAIAAARDYPARRGALLLAWRAALDTLPSAGKPS